MKRKLKGIVVRREMLSSGSGLSAKLTQQTMAHCGERQAGVGHVTWLQRLHSATRIPGCHFPRPALAFCPNACPSCCHTRMFTLQVKWEGRTTRPKAHAQLVSFRAGSQTCHVASASLHGHVYGSGRKIQRGGYY